MKILMTVFDIMDYGGIVNHVELLIRGFREIGHECDLVLLRNTERSPYVNKASTHIAGSFPSYGACFAHTTEGWYGIKVYGYGEQVIRHWHELASRYDLIVHQLPVPKNEGNWRAIYDVEAPQIAIAHDAHFREHYPHLSEVKDKLAGIGCTHHAGYVALKSLPNVALIGAPHVPQNWKSQKPWNRRMNRFVSAHVWKALKRMDKVVMAIPYLKEMGVFNCVAGDGIEARYMRSESRSKPKYAGIWKAAMDSGMEYLGLISPSFLMEQYKMSKVMVDVSYSPKYTSLGSHFNRSTIEAYNGGCVPLVTKESMEENNPPVRLFELDKTHLEVPNAATPKELAEAIAEAMICRNAEEIIHNGRVILSRHFDYRISAEEFIKLSKGKKAGIYARPDLLHKGEAQRLSVKKRR